MIHVICPNPAIDKLYAIDGFTPGDFVCCSGSIIAGAPEDLYAQISRLCAM